MFLKYGLHFSLIFKADNPKEEFVDLIQSRHIWLDYVNGLPEYKPEKGWFNVGDIISLMPLELTCRVLGIKCRVPDYMSFNKET